MAEKLTEGQKDIRRVIKETVSREAFHAKSYPNEYGARFLQKHAISLSFLLPDDVKLSFMQGEFETKNFRQVVEAIAERLTEHPGITADWLAHELADAYLDENNITKPRSR